MYPRNPGRVAPAPPVNHHLFRYAILVALAAVCVRLVSLPRERPGSQPIELVAIQVEKWDADDFGLDTESDCGRSEVSFAPMYDESGWTSCWMIEDRCEFMAPGESYLGQWLTQMPLHIELIWPLRCSWSEPLPSDRVP